MRRIGFIVVAGVLLLATRAAGDVTIALRSWARVPVVAGAPITVAGVADVRGGGGCDEAARLGAIVVLDAAQPRGADAGGWLTIDVDMVRSAIDSAGGVNWGGVTLSGSRCAVRTAEVAKPSVPATVGARDEHARPTDATASPAPVAEGTLRAAIIERLGAQYGVDAGDLRAVFDNGRDSTRLDQPVGADERTIIEPGASTSSGRVPVRVDVYQGDRIVRSLDCTVRLEIRRAVLVALHTLERGDEVDASALSEESRWTSPGAEQPVDRGRAVGCVARRRVLAGTVLTASDVQMPMACVRGDEVWVHVLSGELRMRVKARALAAGREGEIVKMQVDGSKRCFEARLSGRGVAVMIVDPGRAPMEVAPSVSLRRGGTSAEGRETTTKPLDGWDVDPAELTPDALAADPSQPGADRNNAKNAHDAQPASPTLRDSMRDRRSPTLRAKQDAQNTREKHK